MNKSLEGYNTPEEEEELDRLLEKNVPPCSLEELRAKEKNGEHTFLQPLWVFRLIEKGILTCDDFFLFKLIFNDALMNEEEFASWIHDDELCGPFMFRGIPVKPVARKIVTKSIAKMINLKFLKQEFVGVARKLTPVYKEN